MSSTRARRGSDPPWLRPITDRLSPVIRNMVIAFTLVFLFYALVKEARPFLLEHVAVGPRFLAGELWQPLTALFLHVDPLGVILNIVGLWFIGATIESTLGTHRFLAIFAAAGAGAFIVQLLLATWLGSPGHYVGASTATLGLFVAYAVVFDRSPVRFFGALVLPARTLAFILIGFAVVGNLARWLGGDPGGGPALAADVFAIVVAYLMAGGRGEFLRNLRGPRKPRRKYTVLEGGRGRPTHLN